MDVFSKFIIEDGNLILSRVTYHKQIATDHSKVKGGGWFRREENKFIFYGDSQDFGKAKIEDIQECIKSGNVFSNKMLLYSIADKHTFAYDTGSEIIEL